MSPVQGIGNQVVTATDNILAEDSCIVTIFSGNQDIVTGLCLCLVIGIFGVLISVIYKPGKEP